MNIFLLDENLEKSAEYHNNSHTVKMITEQNQLLSSVHWMNDSQAPYKLTHKNHPCAIWARESLDNYLWLCHSTLALCKEYTFRYQKIHKGEEVANWHLNNLPNILKKGLTDFPQAMPEECKVKDNPIKAYRTYYILHKSHLAKWKNRNIPEWYVIGNI